MFKIIKLIWIISFEPMRRYMVFCANPHSLAEISIIPVMVNESYLFFAYFTVIIGRIWSFIFNFSEIFACLSYSVFSHVVSCSFSEFFYIFLSPFPASYRMTRFAVSTQTASSPNIVKEVFRSCRIFDLASITSLFTIYRHFSSFFSSTFYGTSVPLFSVSKRNKKLITAYNTNNCLFVVVPCLLTFLILMLQKVFWVLSFRPSRCFHAV